jgi:hypothetical protein
MSDDDAAAPIGQATMLANGTIVVDLYRPALARRTYAPSDAQYADILGRVGGLEPGQQKLVPPWRDPFDAARVEAAVHAYVADKKGWGSDQYRVVIEGHRSGVVVVRVEHVDDQRAKAPGGAKSVHVDVDTTSYEVERELALQ